MKKPNDKQITVRVIAAMLAIIMVSLMVIETVVAMY